MRVRLLSRRSALAVLQAHLVAGKLRDAWPSAEIVPMTRSSEGDRDRRVALWAMPDKGLFTTDLSQALVTGEADIVVHSWKDLPIESFPGTTVAGTLERADPRDVLLVRADIAATEPSTLVVLSSSPRRSWQLQTSLPSLLPWRVSHLEIAAIRGNIPTRLEKLLAGDGHALVVAKAALDRLLSADAPPATSAAIRAAIDRCRWMVLPVRECPTAPAQGALAIEVAAARADVADMVRAITHGPTERAVLREREMLRSLGGGCHEAIGATVLPRDYGDVVSLRARVDDGDAREIWTLARNTAAPPRPVNGAYWPRPDERETARRRELDPLPAAETGDLWIARADALPRAWNPGPDQLVWAAGSRRGNGWPRAAYGCMDRPTVWETPSRRTWRRSRTASRHGGA